MVTTLTKKPTDYTEGPVLGSILKMGLPSMFGFLTQHLYSFINMFWLSRLPEGESAVAAVTFFQNMMWVFFSINSLIGPGSVAIISRRYGEREYDRCEKAIKETIVLKLISGLLFSALGFFFMDFTLRFLGATGDSFTLAHSYGKIVILLLPVSFSAYSIFTAMRGVANPHMAMSLMIGSNVLNLILDPFLIFGWWGLPALGIVGAAWATVISFTVCFLAGMVLFYGGYTNVRLRITGGLRLGLDSMWQLIRIGIPAWLGETLWSLSRTIVVPMIAGFGTSVVAAYGIGMQVLGIGIAVLVGIGLGLSSLIGHNVGAGKYERAKKTADLAIGFSALTMAILGIIMFLLARQIMNVFFTSPETIAEGVVMLRIFAVSFPFIGVFLMSENVYHGVGMNMPVMVINIIHAWGFQVLPIWFVTTRLGWSQVAVWWVFCIASFVSACLFFSYYRHGSWLQAKV